MPAPTHAHRTVHRIEPGDHVVVCGAGPAGLTAAYQLAKQDVPVTVLESDHVVGGISRTVQHDGYRFDLGGHRFFTRIAPVQAMWEELLGDDLLDVPRLSRIHYAGKFFHYPLRAGNALKGLGPRDAIRILASYARARLRPSPVEENFEQWVTNRFGRHLYEIFFKTYTEKVWGIPCTEIRAEWAAQRIQNLSLTRAVLSANPLTRRAGDVRTLIDSFKYPRLGPGQMWERCRDRIVERGGEVRTGHRVTALEVRDGRVVAARVAGPDGEERIEAQHVISTMPLDTLVAALGDAATPDARAAASGLSFRALLVVALVVDDETPFPDNWIYVHTPHFRVGRVQNFRNWSAALTPEPGRTCLGMEYFCTEGDDVWSLDDAALVQLATRELGALGLAGGARVVDGVVVRVPKAYPVYDASYRARVDVVRGCLDAIPNLHTVGRNGMHKYNNQDHSMYTAMLTVENLCGASHDVWAVNTDSEYHEAQRVVPREARRTGPAFVFGRAASRAPSEA
ncbi:amine oxidase [Gemmatirosa kalamazoonensis]|uniref:Amine oxidase n=1 Tax=Gemmatirosa kalamazoonensis TaxID=861299 RepID=W0RC96_9BACT|nr:NAD(P)/FAD-dependent oxidoreductase [Gemmatirosa kalamazoonensis]AHG88416.1 amine oxidase [Gemmatirosa kalamazoonensis]